MKQWNFDDSNSPKHQKFKVDKLSTILKFEKIDYKLLLDYYKYKYNKEIRPVSCRRATQLSKDTCCPKCDAPHQCIYDNNGDRGQFQCKICGHTFLNDHNPKPITLICPYCEGKLSCKKDRKLFRIHKCINPNCSYYKNNLQKLNKNISHKDKSKYKLHYIYREFTIDFLKMDLHKLPKNIMNLKFTNTILVKYFLLMKHTLKLKALITMFGLL